MADWQIVLGLGTAPLFATGAWAVHLLPHWSPEVRKGLVAAALGLVALVGLAGLTDPSQIPTQLIQVVHEGGSERVLQALDGYNGHSGYWFQRLGQLRPHPVLGDGLRWLAWLNAGATLAVMVAVWGIAAVRTHSVLIGVLVAAPLAWRPDIQHAAFSELGGPFAALFILGGIATFGLAPPLQESTGRPRPDHGLLWVGIIGAWMTLAALCRSGTAILGGFVVLGALLTAFTTATTRARWRQQGWESLPSRLATQPWTRWVVAGLVLLTFFGNVVSRVVHGHVVWATDALMPTSMRFLPMLLWVATEGNIIWVALAVMGGWVGLLRPARTALLPLGVLAMLRLYGGAGHGVHIEMARYMVPVLPIIALGAADGLHHGRQYLHQRGLWPGVWPIVAAVGLVSLALGPTPQYEPTPRRTDLDQPGWRSLDVLDGNKQREALFLLENQHLTELATCTLVSRFWSDQRDRTQTEPTPGSVGVRPPGKSGWRRENDLPEHVPSPDGTCLVYIWTLDCNLATARDRCREDVAGAELLASRSWTQAIYSQPAEYGDLGGTVEVALYHWNLSREDSR